MRLSALDSWLFVLACWFLAIHLVLAVLGVSFRRPPRDERMGPEWLERERMRHLRERGDVH